MYVNVEQLKKLLLHYDPLKTYYIGRHWRTELGLMVKSCDYVCTYVCMYVHMFAPTKNTTENELEMIERLIKQKPMHMVLLLF